MPLATIVTGNNAGKLDINQIINLLTGVMTDQPVTIGNTLAATALQASGLTGATAVGRYVGVVATGAPVTGTFALGDWITTRDGRIWMCTTAGTPGTWVQPSPPPNTIAGNIQPVGTALAAGATGLAADAGHVHNGAGLLSGNNVWTGQNSFGAALTGAAASTILQASAGALGGTATNRTNPIASFGGTTTNQTELGIRLYREATGADWTTASVVLSMDVDGSYALGAKLSLDHAKFFGFNTENPAYLVDVINPSGSRVFHVDSSGNAASDGGGTISAGGLAGSLLSAATPTALGAGGAGAGTVPSRDDHQHPTTGVALLAGGNTFAGGGTFGGSVSVAGLVVTGSALVDFGTVATGVGGGAIAVLGTVGGSGPTAAGMNSWLKAKVGGSVGFIPFWT